MMVVNGGHNSATMFTRTVTTAVSVLQKLSWVET